MTFDSQTGRPTPTSDLKRGQEVYLIHVGYQNLKLAAPMFDKELLAGVEKIIHRPIVDCVSFGLERYGNLSLKAPVPEPLARGPLPMEQV